VNISFFDFFVTVCKHAISLRFTFGCHCKQHDISVPFCATVSEMTGRWRMLAFVTESFLFLGIHVHVSCYVLQAIMYMCGIEDSQYKDEKIHFWDDVYGFDMRFVSFSLSSFFSLIHMLPVHAYAQKMEKCVHAANHMNKYFSNVQSTVE